MYKTQANYFIDCIKKRRKSNIDINDAIKTQKIIDKSFKSQKKGKLIYN